MTAGGIFPAIVGTVLLVFLMSLAGVPIGSHHRHLSQRICAAQFRIDKK